jgi:5-enolpyruvylshikimate-3-phosphate synthase
LHGVALRLTGGDSVAKSFPDFWRQAAKAGVSAP